MMPQPIEIVEAAGGLQRTREEARQLLEDLRAAYQSLSLAERSLVRNAVQQKGRAHLSREMSKEHECFESAF
jgi:hypothetical protein